VNLPNNATVDDIMESYLQAWKLGVKAVAIYRDGCKQSQPLSAAGSKTANSSKDDARAVAHVEEEDMNAPPRANRHKLQEERASITHKFKVGDHEGYITVGLYPNGEPGELFITMAKEGSTVSGLMDSFALAVSIALQHGVSLRLFCEKFAHTRFEPSGWSGNPEIGYAKSIMDYIFRWLQLRFLTGQQLEMFANLGAPATAPDQSSPVIPSEERDPYVQADASAQAQTKGMGNTAAPQSGIAPEIRATSSEALPATRYPLPADRGLHTGHVADAMKEFVDMGDAPSCQTCGAIMVRNGSCYRCMSCGSTSGCS
jgi:ribonucleoside-diphosphate reductase alpha chain